MAYVGQGIKGGTFSVLDTSGNTYNGSNTTFNLGTQVGSPAQLLVSHDGVIQKPVTDYVLATGGTQITFTTAPASGASIFITEISGAVGAPMNRDINGDELILDADGDTSITADTDDQIDFRIAGADDLRMTANAINVLSGTTLTIDSGATITNSGTANGFGALAGIDDQSSSNDDQITISDTAVIINEDSDDVDFRVESNGNANMLVVDASTDCVAIGQASGSSSYELDISGNVRLYNSGDGFRAIDFDANRGSNGDFLGDLTASWDGTEVARMSFRAGSDTSNKDDATFHVETSESGSLVERFRIGNNGTHGISNNNNIGTTYTLDVQASGTPARINRTPDDGAIMLFQAEGTTEGYVSISGSTCTFQTFTGAHWSQLTDNSKPTILKGTVMESIDEMCEWYQLEFKSNDDAQTDKIKVQHILQAGQSVGDTVKHTHNDGVEYDAKIIKETNNHLPKCKISNTSASTSVYGVFQTWDEDNDMNIVSLGTFLVRIHKDETVAKGDLLESNGDGTAKKQSSTAMLSSTIAKVTANVKIETYSDGSYTVPCTLHCG